LGEGAGGRARGAVEQPVIMIAAAVKMKQGERSTLKGLVKVLNIAAVLLTGSGFFIFFNLYPLTFPHSIFHLPL
jgi:hypothetical protein